MADRNVISHLRIKELIRIFRWFFGATLPDDDAGRDCVRIMADHCAQLHNGHTRFLNFAETAAPWMDAAERFDFFQASDRVRRWWTAEALGQELNLSFADRTELCIRTIAAADVDAAELATLQRQRRAQAERERRRKKREREAKISSAWSGPFTPRQQSILDALTSGTAWQSTADLKAAIAGHSCWRDRLGQPLSPDSFRRLLNREMDALVKLGGIREGNKAATKYGTETRTVGLPRRIASEKARGLVPAHAKGAQREGTPNLSRDTRTSESGEAV